MSKKTEDFGTTDTSTSQHTGIRSRSSLVGISVANAKEAKLSMIMFTQSIFKSSCERGSQGAHTKNRNDNLLAQL